MGTLVVEALVIHLLIRFAKPRISLDERAWPAVALAIALIDALARVYVVGGPELGEAAVDAVEAAALAISGHEVLKPASEAALGKILGPTTASKIIAAVFQSARDESRRNKPISAAAQGEKADR